MSQTGERLVLLPQTAMVEAARHLMTGFSLLRLTLTMEAAASAAIGPGESSCRTGVQLLFEREPMTVLRASKTGSRFRLGDGAMENFNPPIDPKMLRHPARPISRRQEAELIILTLAAPVPILQERNLRRLQDG